MDATHEMVAVVCDGLSNPGRAVAAELLRRGWRVAVQEDAGDVQALADRLAVESAAGERLVAFAGELTAEDDREGLVEFVLDEFGRIDLLVTPPPLSRAARAADLLTIEPASLADALAGGLLAPLFTAQRVANEMIRLIESETIDTARIVFQGSLAAYTTSADQAGDCLAAAGVAMAARLFADRLGEYGISVYEVRAGLLATHPGEPGHEAYDRLIRDGLTPLRRWGQPADIARAVAAIAEDLLPFSTGQVIDVDGGFHLRRL